MAISAEGVLDHPLRRDIFNILSKSKDGINVGKIYDRLKDKYPEGEVYKRKLFYHIGVLIRCGRAKLLKTADSQSRWDLNMYVAI